MTPGGAPESGDDSAHPAESLIASAREALHGAMQVAEAALTLLRAELRLARSSALSLIWLGFALIFFGAGAWLTLTAVIATAIYQMTGNLLIGVGTVALANLAGVVWVMVSMRRCWRDLSLPRTRALLIAPSPDNAPVKINTDATRATS